MKTVATLGEVMLRLKSTGVNRLFQTDLLESTFGGGECNVAVSLCNFGMSAKFISALPDNDIGAACLRELRGFGVDVNGVRLIKNSRMGIYFLESGANQRPSKVIYDRAGSAISTISTEQLGLAEALQGCAWLHISGITPAISATAAALSLQAVRLAKELGMQVSCDLNYRKNLWKYGQEAQEVMGEIAQYTDLLIANEEDFQKSLGIASDARVETGELVAQSYRTIAARAMEQYPNVAAVAITMRESKSADHNGWSACFYDGKDFIVSEKYQITDIVDRVGGGDSFSAGIIYGLNHYSSAADALNFAVAASCLKHSIHGDYNRITRDEVEKLMQGGGSGRVER